jgi:hypothetical protein
MPEKETKKRAQRDKRSGKSPSTQAGEYVREEMHHIRQGKHGARSTKPAIAIGLSKARRSGVKVKPPGRGKSTSKTRKSAARANLRGSSSRRRPSRTRSRAARKALKREGRSAASHRALSRHARSAAKSRSASQRRSSAMKASRTKGTRGRSAAARKAARTRARDQSQDRPAR